jgi:hypothetical protein
MKIFSSPKNSHVALSPDVKKTGKSSKKQKQAPVEKSKMSNHEIREKLAAHVESSNTAKSQTMKKNAKEWGSSFLNPDIKAVKLEVKNEGGVEDSSEVSSEGSSEGSSERPSLKESHLLLSDVKLNDPNDSNTQEKLKSVLRNGAFNFNPKEKDTLEKILAGS